MTSSKNRDDSRRAGEMLKSKTNDALEDEETLKGDRLNELLGAGPCSQAGD